MKISKSAVLMLAFLVNWFKSGVDMDIVVKSTNLPKEKVIELQKGI